MKNYPHIPSSREHPRQYILIHKVIPFATLPLMCKGHIKSLIPDLIFQFLAELKLFHEKIPCISSSQDNMPDKSKGNLNSLLSHIGWNPTQRSLLKLGELEVFIVVMISMLLNWSGSREECALLGFSFSSPLLLWVFLFFVGGFYTGNSGVFETCWDGASSMIHNYGWETLEVKVI